MENSNSSGGIQRKPIIIKHNRRSEYNPEFLDIELLLEKFTPLFKSICRYFCSYAGILDKSYEIEDLYSQIQLEFIKLVRRYDPKRGVDLPGYIKLNLQNRVYYWVIKLQKFQRTEKLLYLSEEDDETLGSDLDYISHYYDAIDDSSEQEKSKIEALMSIPWDKLDNDSDREMVMDILNHLSLEDIARKRHTLISNIQEQFNRIIDLLIAAYRERDDYSV